MSEHNEQEKMQDLDKAIDELADLLETRESEKAAAPEQYDIDEADIPVLLDVVTAEEELATDREPPVLRKEEHFTFQLLNNDEAEEEEDVEPPLKAEDILQELESIVDEELEKVTRSARASILDNLKSRLDSRLEARTAAAEASEDTDTDDGKAVYLPMSNWKKDEADDVGSLPLFNRKSDDS